ncbi:MAG: glycosyltransferase [Deltaproteobacteria bacterium]|nr:glycosyltransferase [Deltaproteobacteria bacterium]
MPVASVIIRAKNEAAEIGAVLRRVLDQRYGDFEVVVVDSGSTDRTVEIAQKLGVRVVQIAPEAFTYGRALNLGMRETASPYGVFLSAHALPFDRDWLRNLLAPFDDSLRRRGRR